MYSFDDDLDSCVSLFVPYHWRVSVSSYVLDGRVVSRPGYVEVTQVYLYLFLVVPSETVLSFWPIEKVSGPWRKLSVVGVCLDPKASGPAKGFDFLSVQVLDR